MKYEELKLINERWKWFLDVLTWVIRGVRKEFVCEKAGSDSSKSVNK